MPEGNGDRLDGWKEISAYLNRSIRSAQRWNQEMGMPVHRVQGVKGTIVHAFRSEIDEWLLTNEVPPNGQAETKQKGKPTRPWLFGWAVLATIAAVFGWGLFTLYDPGGESAHGLDPSALASGDSGVPRAARSLGEDGRDFPPPRGLVVFVSKRGGNNDIYIIDDDGNNERRITDHPAADTDGVLAPDGSKIAFCSDRAAGVPGIFVQSIDGGDPHQVFLAPADREGRIQGLDWNLDGDRILFGMRLGGTWNLFEIGEDGSELVQITDGGEDSRLPKYSLDGSRILFTRNISFNGFTEEIFELFAGDQVRQLTFTGDNGDASELLMEGVPALVFSKGMPDANSQLFIYSRGSGESPIYPENNTYQEGNAVGPRGPGAGLFQGQIIFTTNRAGDRLINLWRMRVDGSGAFQITFEGGNSPRWWIPEPATASDSSGSS
jgi:hypothetical protein